MKVLGIRPFKGVPKQGTALKMHQRRCPGRSKSLYCEKRLNIMTNLRWEMLRKKTKVNDSVVFWWQNPLWSVMTAEWNKHGEKTRRYDRTGLSLGTCLKTGHHPKTLSRCYFFILSPNNSLLSPSNLWTAVIKALRSEKVLEKCGLRLWMIPYLARWSVLHCFLLHAVTFGFLVSGLASSAFRSHLSTTVPPLSFYHLFRGKECIKDLSTRLEANTSQTLGPSLPTTLLCPFEQAFLFPSYFLLKTNSTITKTHGSSFLKWLEKLVELDKHLYRHLWTSMWGWSEQSHHLQQHISKLWRARRKHHQLCSGAQRPMHKTPLNSEVKQIL